MLPNPNDMHSQISYVEEFSLPPYFFDKHFLDNADLCEPHVKAKCSPTTSCSVTASGCPTNGRNVGAVPGHRVIAHCDLSAPYPLFKLNIFNQPPLAG